MPTNPSRDSAEILDELRAVPIGSASPFNVGASRALPEHIIKEMEKTILGDRLCVHLLGEFMRDTGMSGPEGEHVNIEMHLSGELRVTRSTAEEKIRQQLRVVPNGRSKRRRSNGT